PHSLLIYYCVSSAASACPSPRFNRHPSPETHALSLHDALPIFSSARPQRPSRSTSSAETRARCTPLAASSAATAREASSRAAGSDRKSTRLNSSHVSISYAVFCLKKKTYSRNE